MTDLFDQNNQETPNNVALDSNNPFEDKLKVIVNDQGQPKYKDIPSALDALKASQEHIKRLEDEAKAAQALTAESVANKARADALEEIVNRLSNNSGKPAEPATPVKEAPTEEAIVKQLENIIARKEAQSTAQKNIQAVQTSLIAKFGDEAKTKEAVAAKAKELGLTPQKLGALSSETPLAVLALFGITSNNGAASTIPSATPLNPHNPDKPLERPAQSVISGPGATDANRKALMNKIKEEVYKKYEVQV